MVERITDGYPIGASDELGVCFVHKATAEQYMERVSSDAESLACFEDFKKRPDVLWQRRRGEFAPMIWIAKCKSGRDWIEPPETDLTDEYF